MMRTRRIILTGVVLMASVWCMADDAQRKYDYYFMEALMQREKGGHDNAFALLSRCVELNPNASEAYFFLAQYYAVLKKPELSLAYFQKAAELSPENSTYLETVAQAYATSGRFPEAVSALEELYNRHKDRVDVLEMLYQLYQQQKDYRNALSALQRIENFDGKNERLSYAKSEMYSLMGDKKAAVAEMKSLADQYPNDLNYRALYADMLMSNDEGEQALTILEDILREEPDNSHAQLSMRSYYRERQMELEADSMTERILLNKNAASNERIYLMRQEIADSENSVGDSTRVLRLFRKALSQPQSDADMATLCATYMSLKKMPTDSVAGMLETVLAIEPDNVAARLQLVGFAWDADSLDRVVALCQAARQYNPDEMAFYYYQGMAYFRQNDYDHALEAFRHGIGVIDDQSDPAIVSDFYAVMGEVFHQKGMMTEAFAAYDSCLQWKPDHIMCLNNYAYFLSERGEQLDRAEQMSYKAVKAEPKNATYLDTYAWILFMQNRYSEAKIYIDQALKNDTDSNAVIVEHAGDIYALNKEMPKALSLWQDALDKDPGNRVLIRKIKLKKYLRE